MMSDVQPMLLTEIPADTDCFEKYKNWLWQEKQNGTRILLHIKDERAVSMRNRRQIPCLHLYPEIKEMRFEGVKNAIVDGEMCVFDDKQKSVFYGGINQRDKKLYDEMHIEKFPVVFVAFDLIYLNYTIMVKKPYSERYDFLRQFFSENKHFKLSENIENPKSYWEEKIVPEQREGLVIKNPDAMYEAGIRSKQYLKFKFYKQIDVEVINMEINNAGTKIYGKANLNGKQIEAECQFGGIFDLNVGDIVPVEYLDVVGNKLIQPHKVKGWKNGDS